ncbi:MAG: 50S ribosomal protein L3 [Elusimicrobia bacterium RIFOXYA2_FULL_58_8]|nr:MAG: 50S ribosomal protein L3 [Elusimicrobia bacterium RIFOXYA2_FULL_58_8]OGS13726.1 MAG: 50S ribosomal protein L3 [Elusimicrobia bacterium RIFOXYA12_FULL_57_11]
MPKTHKFLVGQKMGMTQIFGADGALYGVTVVKAGPCRVAYTRTKEKDGYQAVCLGFGHKKEQRANAAEKGLAKKLAGQPIRHLKEFRVNDLAGAAQGQIAGVERFAEGDYVDLQGVSKGKGFAGGMKRHNFRGGPASRGASDRERAPGSLGSRRSLGRVLPGQRMAGHMGDVTVSVQKMKVIKIIAEENMLLVNGGIPGAAGSMVYIINTVKKIPKPPAPVASKKGKKDAAKPAAKKPDAKK